MFLSDILGHLGNKMMAEEVNHLITVSELDEKGALNYDEALKTSLNILMEAELNEEISKPPPPSDDRPPPSSDE